MNQFLNMVMGFILMVIGISGEDVMIPATIVACNALLMMTIDNKKG